MKNLFLLPLALVFFIACTNKEAQKPMVTVTTTGIDDAAISLKLTSNDSTLASGNLVDGAATLDAPLAFPQMVLINIAGVENPIVFYADLTQMSVTIDGTSTPPSFKVTGSAYNDSLEVFGETQSKNRAFMGELRPAWEAAMAANDSLTMFVINTKADSAYQYLNDYTKAFATRNGLLGTMISMRYMYSAEYNDLLPIYDNVEVRYRNAPDVVAFKNRMDIIEKTQVGKRFIDITQKDTTGADLSISSIKADYILIDFWASWCGPCRNVNPELVKIHSEFKDKGFQIVGVSLDQERENWKKAIVEDKLNWPQMSDLKGWQNEGAAVYAIRSIPQSIIIDDQGFIVNKNLTPEELRAFLEDKLD